MPSSIARPLRLAPALLALSILPPCGHLWGATQEPFSAGLRWTLPAPLAEPWIPGSLALAASGELVWSSAAGTAARFLLAPSAGSGLLAPLHVDSAPLGAVGSLQVAAAADGLGLFGLAQYPAPDVWHRRSLVTRYDVLAAAAGAAFQPAWTSDLGVVANGPARLATDAAGGLVFAAAFDEAAGQLAVSWIDGASGLVLARHWIGAPSLRALALCADGSLGALLAGSTLHLWAGPSAQPIALPLGNLPFALSLSADGGLVAVGGTGSVQLLARTGRGHQPLPPIVATPSQAALRVALSADGSTLASAWWDLAGAGLTRLEVHAPRQGTLLLQRSFQSPAGAPQNAPVALRLSADGRRVALASWGDGGSSPQILLLERDSGASLLEVYLPGSAMDLALDEGGTRLVVATKNVHANQLGTTGELRLYDTGERDLELLEPARQGGRLRLAARRPGASRAFFLLGRPITPQAFPGVGGLLSIDRMGIATHSRPTDAHGRADLDLGLPADPTLIGAPLRAQAALRVVGGLHLSVHAIDLLIL